ncbi:hypothetical protein ACXR0O_12685 [Verrucomicrobiota bacterium sgz303538]
MKRMAATALGCGIHVQGKTVEDLRENVKGGSGLLLDGSMAAPKIIRLRFVREAILAR